MSRFTHRQLLAYGLVRDHAMDAFDAMAVAAMVDRADGAWHRTNIVACVFSRDDGVDFRIAKATRLLRACGYIEKENANG